MSRRDLCQPSFVDAMVSGYGKVGGFLDRIEQGFDWSAFEALLSPIHGSAMGAPGYPPLTMFKILLLQQWHTLSDPAAEEAVRDRLSFRRFCGLPLDVETPDHASIWRFRQTIDKLGLSVGLLTEVNRQLDARGFVIKRGTLVDATIIAGAVRRPYEGGGVNPRDPEARFTRKRDSKDTSIGTTSHGLGSLRGWRRRRLSRSAAASREREPERGFGCAERLRSNTAPLRVLMRSSCRLSDHHKPMRPRPTMRSLLTSKIGEICANRQL